MPTIYEVAKHAGVSTATVSRVMGGLPSSVSPDTRRRVLATIEELGYTPNAAAQTLRTHSSRTILVTVPDLANPFFAHILQGIEDAAQRDGYAVLIGDTQHEPAREERYARMLRQKEADGLIFLGHRLPHEAHGLMHHASRVPIVNGCEFSDDLGVPSVHIDNAKAAFEVIDHLLSLGHQRIGIVTGPSGSPLSRDRLRGAFARAQQAGVHRDLVVINGDFTIESGARAADRLLDQRTPPTAIFCFNDEMAIGLVETAHRRGVRVPDDLSVAGFDDIRFARFTRPPLTTVAQPMREIGRGCVRLLLQILRGEAPESMSITLPHKLTIRASTARPRASGRWLGMPAVG